MTVNYYVGQKLLYKDMHMLKALLLFFFSLPLYSQVANYYSPATDLEKIDLALIDKATSTLDISTYALADSPIAEALKAAADRGVHIRIYRDLRQYAGEEARGPSPTDKFLLGNKNIEIRVKHSSVLAHLKGYVEDGSVLREGSANWSFSGEALQDNSLIIIHDTQAVRNFESNFSIIWNRPDNKVIQ